MTDITNLISDAENRCHMCGEVINLANLIHETRHGLASVLYIRCSCYHGKLDVEENNSHLYIFVMCLFLIWRHSHECYAPMTRLQDPQK